MWRSAVLLAAQPPLTPHSPLLGSCTLDMQNTVTALVSVSNLPLPLLGVGLGKNGFLAMEARGRRRAGGGILEASTRMCQPEGWCSVSQLTMRAWTLAARPPSPQHPNKAAPQCLDGDDQRLRAPDV